MNTILIVAAVTVSGVLAALQDTPEVAHAKAEHFAAVAKARALEAGGSGWASAPYYPEEKYHGPVALPPGYDHHGAPLQVLDTPEVAHTKAERIAALSKAGGSVYPSTGPDPWSHAEEYSGKWIEPKYEAAGPKYHGPFAYSPGYDKHGAPLPVVETSEVQHAKAEHFAAYAKVASHAPSVGHKWKRSIHEHAVSAAEHAHYAAVEKVKAEIAAAAHYYQPAAPHYAPEAKYHGPVALPPGYDHHGAPLPVLDTPEVAHTKTERLAAVSKAGGSIHPAPPSPYYAEEHESLSSWSEPHHAPQYTSDHIKYHGPFAYSPGYDKHGAPLPVVETSEVQHAKAEHFVAYAKAASHAPSVGHKWKRSIHEHAVSAAEHAHYAAVEKVKSEIAAAAHYHQPAAPHYAPEAKYHGPVALPPGYDHHGAPLPVLDTPEVAHTKSERLAAVSKAGGSIHPAPPSPYYAEEHESSSSWSEPHHAPQYASEHIKYHGPIALPPGYDKHGAPLQVLDTPEVAAAKSKHLHTYADTLSKLGPSMRDQSYDHWANKDW